ncbi:MAG: LysR family transcriptional regulator [Gammaproteobacteria bacterium]|nr:MAG: LysR family transcriptional regulator [Gammaproteobacteria bacterium]
MSRIDDIELFVRVVKAGGLAAAGRQIGLSPSSMTARINALEQRYQTRLLNRTTRRISLTDAGESFYRSCQRILEQLEDAEACLQKHRQSLSGRLRITAPSDFGAQYVAPALEQFARINPGVRPHLHLGDGVVNLIEQGFDLGVRFGNLPDSNLVVRHLADNHRVLVAAPAYVREHGRPASPEDLSQHRCLVLERHGEALNEWRFRDTEGNRTVSVRPALSSNDGSVIRRWALAGAGIACKSIWDVKQDIASGRLVTLLDGRVLGFQHSDSGKTDLQIIYPSRRYLPRQVAAFIEYLRARMDEEGRKLPANLATPPKTP